MCHFPFYFIVINLFQDIAATGSHDGIETAAAAHWLEVPVTPVLKNGAISAQGTGKKCDGGENPSRVHEICQQPG